MEDQITEAIGLGQTAGPQFREQLDRMREFKDRMQTAGATPRSEQFAVRNLEPVEPRRSISFNR